MVLALAGALSGAVLPASAVDIVSVRTFGQLQTAFAAGGMVQLDADISGPGLIVASGKDVTLLLGGHTLTVTGTGDNGSTNGQAGIGVQGGASFTLDGEGTLIANGGPGSAGVGGRYGSEMGAVVINGGAVVATGGLRSSGIGTGQDATGDPGSITINGGTVTAKGETAGGAGIGGGMRARTPVVTITGGTVTARSGGNSAAIGSGRQSLSLPVTISITGGVVDAQGTGPCEPGIGAGGETNGGWTCFWDSLPVTLTISESAHVTASTSVTQGVPTPAVRVFGGGGGSFENAGTLVIPSGSRLDIPDGSSVQNDGVIRGTVTGEVSGNNFLLSFDANGGSSAPVALRVYAPTLEAAQITVPGGALWWGATFAAWSSSPTLGAGKALAATTQLSTATWYARWLGPAVHEVSFITDGGSAVEPVSVLQGDVLTLPPEPTKAGSNFAGWYTRAVGGAAWDAATLIVAPTTLFARWTVNTYAVTFASGGGGSVASQTIAHGAKIVEPEALIRTGYTFVGWFAPGSATAWAFGTDTVTGPTALTARWTVNSYAVTFATVGGGTVAAQTIDYGAKIVEPEALTRVGYTFVGWFAPGSTTAWDFDTDTVTGATALTAHWTLNTYPVTFDGAGSGPVDSQIVEHGAKTAEPEAPTRTGYTFVGWFAPGSAMAWNFSSDIVTGAVALVAHWSEHTSVVVSASPEVSVVVGAAVTVKGTVTPAGATGTVELFDGATSLGSGPVSAGAFSVITTTLGEGDRVLTAVFTPADALFVGSTSDPVGLRVNAKAPQGPAPAANTDDLLDLVDENGWPILPDGATVAWPDGRDSFVDVFVYSTPVALGVLPVVDGKVQRDTLVLPALAPGAHHLVFVGQTTGKVTVIEFVVPEPTTEEPGTTPPGTTPPGTTPPSTQTPALVVTGGAPGAQPTAVGLATTGTTLAPMLALAGAVVALGVLLTSTRPRRRRS